MLLQAEGCCPWTTRTWGRGKDRPSCTASGGASPASTSILEFWMQSWETYLSVAEGTRSVALHLAGPSKLFLLPQGLLVSKTFTHEPFLVSPPGNTHSSVLSPSLMS